METIILFWSWQSDSPANVNRNFIQKCLEKAAKKIGKATARLVEVERDTQGVGGTPNIADTILQKIRSSDVFIWDATIVGIEPKPAPNANVLFELGYAVAVLGWERIIGVMNTASGHEPDLLPFDLRHRRWPIRYVLSPNANNDEKKKAGTDLTNALEKALIAALQEPKRGALHADTDLLCAKRLWKIIDSDFLHNWHMRRTNTPQFEEREAIQIFRNYLVGANKPENSFRDPTLTALHGEFLTALSKYSGAVGINMVPMANSQDMLIITTKASSDDRWTEDYDENYEQQIDLITESADAVFGAWKIYVMELASRFPEVIDAQ